MRVRQVHVRYGVSHQAGPEQTLNLEVGFSADLDGDDEPAVEVENLFHRARFHLHGQLAEEVPYLASLARETKLSGERG